MITSSRGNLLTADVDALVNTVNTVGVMGKGIALQFRRAFPDMFKVYAKAAKSGQIQIGKMHVWETGQLDGPRFVINFPTKTHWRAASRLSDIEAGLVDLVSVVRGLGISSIAVPPLGCGHGGLPWAEVEPLIRGAFEALPDVAVHLYPPEGAPAAAAMPSGAIRPAMTPARAAVIELLHRYEEVALETSLVEVQKLCYFLQVSGEPLRLQFVKHHYGPYADNLRHTLMLLEGHYLTGYGDGSSGVLDAEPLRLLPGSMDAASRMLAPFAETTARIDRVLKVVEGFESMYGLELLASVHWVATQESSGADAHRVARLVRAWTPRKGRLFTEQHIASALNVLRDGDWLVA